MTTKPSPTRSFGNSLPNAFWSVVGWWGRHQRYWWLTIGLLTVAWLGYDVGRVATRADLVSLGSVAKGAVSLSEVETKAKQYGGGRLILTSSSSARFIDGAGQAWEIPDFANTVTKQDLKVLKDSGVLIDGEVSIELTPVKTSPRDILASTLIDIAIKLLFIGFYAFIVYIILKHLNNARGQRFRSVANADKSTVRIADVAGHEGVKKEVLEIVEYLKDPARYDDVGARPPQGVLMHGPPGTGKTLLAKAIAGEADAHFIEQSASSFVQVYAGEGAKSVRKLFEEARKNRPCVIFIDEIDAIGTSRDRGGHDERIQTLNALLTEMDGFADNSGIVVVAATNRVEVLDDALVRPGRFDRKVHVPLPSRDERLAILEVHAKKLPTMQANLPYWADQTRGFSGAFLASLVNEAAIEAARKRQKEVGDAEFSAARDRVLIGSSDGARRASDKDRKVVAYHELGHAVVRLRKGGGVEKVSILPRGRSLGVTVTALAEIESALQTETEMRTELVVLMGGRAAEQSFCGGITGGASDDMERASQMARLGVLRYGFEGHGPYVPENDSLLREMEVSARTWVNTAYEEAVAIVKSDAQAIEELVVRLLEHDELSGEAIAAAIAINLPLKA